MNTVPEVPKRDIALAVAHSAAADSSGSIVAGARTALNVCGQTQRLGSVGSQRPHRFPAFKQLRHLGLR